MLKILFKKRGDVTSPLISLNNRQAGIDFHSPTNFIVSPRSSCEVDLLISWKPEFIFFWDRWAKKVYMQIKARSSLAFKYRLEITNAGVIDEDYRGSIKVILYNKGSVPVTINKGDRICQGIVIVLPKTKIEIVDDLKEERKNTRGEKGFGSTGK